MICLKLYSKIKLLRFMNHPCLVLFDTQKNLLIETIQRKKYVKVLIYKYYYLNSLRNHYNHIDKNEMQIFFFFGI